MIQIKELLSLDNRKKCSIINSMNMKEILTKYKWEFKEQGEECSILESNPYHDIHTKN